MFDDDCFVRFDYFGRTSTPLHSEYVSTYFSQAHMYSDFARRISQEVYLNLQDRGFLERQNKEQTYCENCAK